MLKRTIRYLALSATGLSGSLFACGSPSTANPTPTTNATVSIALYDTAGTNVGSCLGTMISQDTVVTAGHCVAGYAWWQVTTSNGQLAHSSVGYTFNWQDFQSDMSHPDHDDVAVLKLDTQVNLAQYPSLAYSPLSSGAAAMRIRPASSGGVEAIGIMAYDGSAVGFPHYYYSSFDSEPLVTGGAMIDPIANVIYGVTSGVGETTGNLYMSRIELVSGWLAQMATCSGGSTTGTASTDSTKVVVECHTGSSSGSSSGGCDEDAAPPPRTSVTAGAARAPEAARAAGPAVARAAGPAEARAAGPAEARAAGPAEARAAGPAVARAAARRAAAATARRAAVEAQAAGARTMAEPARATAATARARVARRRAAATERRGARAAVARAVAAAAPRAEAAAAPRAAAAAAPRAAAAAAARAAAATARPVGAAAESSGGGSSGGSSSGSAGGGGNGTNSSSGGTAGGGNGGYNGTGSGASGGGNGTTGGNGGDGSGCTDSSCGGCGDDPTCSDNTEDFGGVPGQSSGSASGRAY